MKWGWKPPRRYKPPPIPRPLIISSFHELVKWFKQVELDETSAVNGTTIMYTVPPGHVLFIDHISVRGMQTAAVDTYCEVRMNNSQGNTMRRYYLGIDKSSCNCRSFVIPIAGDYLKEGETIVLFSPAATVTIYGSFHGWEGTRVQ